MVTFIVFLAVLSILIFVHELGHFLMAKKAGVRVEEFGLGYPPRVFGKKIGETVYSINILPFGGFVKLFGEELADERGLKRGKALKDTFWAKSKKARTAVICAGVLANFILAVMAFSIVYSVVGIPTKIDQVRIVGVVSGSPAEEAGFKEGDVIIKVDGRKIETLDQFIDLVEEKKGETISVVIDRPQKGLTDRYTIVQPFVNIEIEVIPRKEPPEGEGPLGVIVSNVEMKKFPFWQMPFRGAVEGFKEAFGWTILVVSSLGKMLADLIIQGIVPKDIAGPIGILQITGGVAESGILAVLQFVGILSVNLAVINILPFPALDGGRLSFVVYEVITCKRPKPNFERWVNTIGMAVLILLIVLVTINDIVRIFETSNLASQLRLMLPF